MAQKPTVPEPWTTVNPTTRRKAAGRMTPEAPLLTGQADATWSRLPFCLLLPPDTAESLTWDGACLEELSGATVDVIHARLCDDKQRHNRVSGRMGLWLCGSPMAQKISLHNNIFALSEASPLMWL